MYRDLDALIRAARPAEDPSDHDRVLVRRAVELRIARGRSASEGARDGGVTLGTPVFALVVSLAAALGLSADSPLRVSSFAPPAPRSTAQPTQPLGAPLPALDDEAAPKDMAESAAAASAAPEPARASGDVVPPPAARAVARAGREHPAAAASTAPAANLSAESRALMQAQRALRARQPGLALRLLAEQDSRFAHGVLLEERAAASVFARCAQGDRDGARRAARGFAVRYPGSPLKSRVLATCAEGTELDHRHDGKGR